MASGGWSGSTRRATLPPGWAKTRVHILKRDGHSCQWGSVPEDAAPPRSCLAPANQVDHYGAADDHSRLRALCAYHHKIRSSSQGGRAAQAKAASRFRAPEQHPGMIG